MSDAKDNRFYREPQPSSNERVKPEVLAALREMAHGAIAVKGDLLIQLLDEIEAARSAPEPGAVTGGAVAHMDELFRDDTTMCEVLKTEWIAAKKELIADRRGLSAEQVSAARESLLDAVAERVRAAPPPPVARCSAEQFTALLDIAHYAFHILDDSDEEIGESADGIALDKALDVLCGPDTSDPHEIIRELRAGLTKSGEV